MTTEQMKEDARTLLHFANAMEQMEITIGPESLRAIAARLSSPLAGDKPVAWMYEHDGMIHDDEHPPVVTHKRWEKCEEPWNETPLVRAAHSSPPPASVPAEPPASASGGEASIPDDIRAAGWVVAIHNDYQQNGEANTFWLFTRDSECVKGEGASDADALNIIRKKIGIASLPPAAPGMSEEEIAYRVVRSQLADEVDALRKFKAYVHKRLDDAGISTHPDGAHSKEGCRVGDRLDIALAAPPATICVCNECGLLMRAKIGEPHDVIDSSGCCGTTRPVEEYLGQRGLAVDENRNVIPYTPAPDAEIVKLVEALSKLRSYLDGAPEAFNRDYGYGSFVNGDEMLSIINTALANEGIK